MGGGGYAPASVRRALLTTSAVGTALIVAACGSEQISVSKEGSTHDGAVLFAQRCGGCHTLSPAATQGSANRAVRSEGPNLDQRAESVPDVLFAIRNGGFSGGIMPQNIVTGHDATQVARFVSEYAGSDAQATAEPPGSG